MFVGLFFLTKFYFEKRYIYVSVFLTWTPQIIFNFFSKNYTSMPLINILIMSINKISIPFYFRLIDDNVFEIKPDLQFCQILVIIVSSQVNNKLIK